jgi:hypothetical protein
MIGTPDFVIINQVSIQCSCCMSAFVFITRSATSGPLLVQIYIGSLLQKIYGVYKYTWSRLQECIKRHR